MDRKSFLKLAGTALLASWLGSELREVPVGLMAEESAETPDVSTVNYVIYKEGETTCARNGQTGLVEQRGTDSASVINETLAALAPERKLIEKVTLKGDFIINETIKIPSYTALDMTAAKLTLARDVSKDMFTNLDHGSSNTWVIVQGGHFDGNKWNNKAGSCFKFRNCYFTYILPRRIDNFKEYGIYYSNQFGYHYGLNYIGNCRVHLCDSGGIRLDEYTWDSFLFNIFLSGNGDYANPALYLSGAGGIAVDNVHVAGGFGRCTYGVEIEDNGGRTLVTNLTVEMTSKHGVYIHDTKRGVNFAKFVNVDIRDPGLEANNEYDGIYVYGTPGKSVRFCKFLGVDVYTDNLDPEAQKLPYEMNKARYALNLEGDEDYNIALGITARNCAGGVAVKYGGLHDRVRHTLYSPTW